MDNATIKKYLQDRLAAYEKKLPLLKANAKGVDDIVRCAGVTAVIKEIKMNLEFIG